MGFDSGAFFVFFAITFLCYHLVAGSLRIQNALLLVASLVFYGWWDWRFLGLLLLSSGVDYLAGILIEDSATEKRRRLVLLVSLTVNLSVLFVFKYFDFFSVSLGNLLDLMGLHVAAPTLGVVLPVGVSFYTFQSMAYTIDIHRGEIRAERNPISYFCFVCLFPHMVAGPIQRASHLLRQVNSPRRVSEHDVHEAVWLLAYGYFLKVLIADFAAGIIDLGFVETPTTGWLSILSTLAFTLQIYCDFLAYSLIARGTGRLLGFEFIWNFNQPYFSTSIQDFWRRWHISLSTWLRDYLYISLGGNRKGPVRTYANLLMTMFLGGLWHGASWNFVIWGALHGFALAGHKLYRDRTRLVLPDLLGWVMTMAVVVVGWFVFRCTSMAMAVNMVRSLRDLTWSPRDHEILVRLATLALPVAVVEVWQFRTKNLLAPLRLPAPLFALLTGCLATLALVTIWRARHAFIYFQF